MTSFAQVEFADFEWVKHRPSWGEIPVARSNHIAFVYDKKMFIMGGQTTGAAPDGGVANNIPYLDLSTCCISLSAPFGATQVSKTFEPPRHLLFVTLNVVLAPSPPVQEMHYYHYNRF